MQSGYIRSMCQQVLGESFIAVYSYSEMGSKIFYRCFEVDDVGAFPQANLSRPPRGQKLLYPYTREGSPPGGQTRSCPWREAHSLSPCPDGQRRWLRTRKPNPIARVLHPRSDDTRCCPADSSWACPPGSRRIDVYPQKVPARPEAKSAPPGRTLGRPYYQFSAAGQLSHETAAGTAIGNSALMGTYVRDEYRLFHRFFHRIPVLFQGLSVDEF